MMANSHRSSFSARRRVPAAWTLRCASEKPADADRAMRRRASESPRTQNYNFIVYSFNSDIFTIQSITSITHMSYVLEPISENGISRIQKDLINQELYKDMIVEKFISFGPASMWAIDRTAGTYLHGIRGAGPSSGSLFHFFNGVSHVFSISESLFETTCSLRFIDPANPERKKDLLVQIQEAFNTFGRSGYGPNQDEFSHVNLILTRCQHRVRDRSGAHRQLW